jgi:hypothetical protein
VKILVSVNKLLFDILGLVATIKGIFVDVTVSSGWTDEETGNFSPDRPKLCKSLS